MLPRTLFHLYGSFCIQSYGLTIAIGVIVTYYLIKRDPGRARIISDDLLINVFSLSILSGVLGGRILYLIGNYHDITSWLDLFTVHKGGLSILGSIITTILVLAWYLKRHNIRILAFFDLLAIYAPLLQAFSRFGCYFAGCCFGKQTTAAWAITYKASDTFAPRFHSLHPTQLYSAFGLFTVFLFLYYYAQNRLTRAGQLFFCYLGMVSLVRFLVDFLRGDQEFFTHTLFMALSIHQWIALIVMGLSVFSFVYISHKK